MGQARRLARPPERTSSLNRQDERNMHDLSLFSCSEVEVLGSNDDGSHHFGDDGGVAKPVDEG